jgi:hypothetical protein
MVKLFLILFAGLLGLVLVIPPYQEEVTHPHIHAGFLIYRDNRLIDFSDAKYMHVEVCSEDPSHSATNEQIEKAHLHNLVGDVVHVHRTNAVWGDLFQNLGYQLDATASAYIDGEQISAIKDYPIQAFDSLIILEGENTTLEEKIASAVTSERIAAVEAMIESCGL